MKAKVQAARGRLKNYAAGENLQVRKNSGRWWIHALKDRV